MEYDAVLIGDLLRLEEPISSILTEVSRLRLQ